jgi:hypothetical protein
MSNWVKNGRGDALMTHMLASSMMVAGGAQLFNVDISNWFLFGAMPTGPTPLLGLGLSGAQAAVRTGQTGFQQIFAGTDPVLIRLRDEAFQDFGRQAVGLLPGGIFARSAIDMLEGEASLQQTLFGLRPLPEERQEIRARRAQRARSATGGIQPIRAIR